MHFENPGAFTNSNYGSDILKVKVKNMNLFKSLENGKPIDYDTIVGNRETEGIPNVRIPISP